MSNIWKHKSLVGITVARETVFKHESVRGLRLRVYPSGRKTWQWLRQRSGKPFRETIGRFPAVSLLEAQVRAEEMNARFDGGLEPIEPEPEPVATVERMTVEQGWTRYILDCERRGRKSGPGSKRDLLGRKDIVSVIGDKFLKDVTTDDVRCVIEAPLKRKTGRTGGARQSNHNLSVCKTFLRHCAKYGYDGLERNPANPVDPIINVSGSRPKRWLTLREMALAILAARELDRINDGKSTWADIITLLVMNGNRKAEVMDAMGNEWDRAGRLWNISGERYKTDVPCVLPVGPSSAAIFDRRARAGEFLFPSQSGVRTGQDRHIVDRLTELMERIGGQPVPHWYLHASRYGFRSGIRKAGIASKELAERIIHPKAEDDEVEYDIDWGPEMREALCRWDELVSAEIRLILGLSVAA